MRATVRLLPLLLLSGIAACQGDTDAVPASTGAGAAPVAAPSAAPGPEAGQVRTVQTSFDLPATPILSIRLQPTTSTQGRVAFSRLALVADGERTEIDLCVDKHLQLVRSRKVPGNGVGCEIEFGNGTGTGWIAPTDLRNLPAIEGSRELEVAASGDLEGAFKVYLDVGNGYGSRDMLQAASTAAPGG